MALVIEAMNLMDNACRFCLTTDQIDDLSDIYVDNGLFPLKIMACVSIEVGSDDGMPKQICNACRLLMDQCYRFRQMCSKADTLLKQYTVTGEWPKPLQRPIMELDDVSETRSLFKQEQNFTPPRHNLAKRTSENTHFRPSLLKRPSIRSNSSVHTVLKLESVKSEPIMQHDEYLVCPSSFDSMHFMLNLPEDDESRLSTASNNYQDSSEQSECEPFTRQENACQLETKVQRVFACILCDKQFFRNHHLTSHMLAHSRSEPYQCEMQSAENEEDSLVCGICDLQFLTKERLEQHVILHSEVPSHLITHAYARSAIQ